MFNSASVQQVESEDFSNYGLFAGSHPIPLKMTLFTGVIKGSMTHMTMDLVFENIEENSIEAVYTFPVPDDAVFLGLELTMNGKTYQTEVVEKAEARESYEETVTDGDAAIIVSEVAKNLFAMEIGNIPPKTYVRIKYEYSILHEWKGEQLRWRLPTVLAPRYGESFLEPQIEPESDLMIEHKHTFHLTVEDDLANCECISPSHNVLIKEGDGSKIITLKSEFDLLNRDVIILFKDSGHAQPVANVVWDRDLHNQYCSLLSLKLPEVNNKKVAPKLIKILIDCSGSMTGDSMTQARQAIREMMSLMNPQDKVMIWKFGSSIEKLHSKPILASNINHNIFQKIEADLGGTELFDAVMKISKEGVVGNELDSNIFLITDGEVWSDDSDYQKIWNALGSNQRIFTVGIGSAVSTEVLNKLSNHSNGAVELVTPNENMADRMTTHFKRMYAPKVNSLKIHWPSEVSFENIPSVLFSGDTAYVSAKFEQMPKGEVKTEVIYENGEIGLWACKLNHNGFSKNAEPLNVLSRTISSRALQNNFTKPPLKLALDYQLMTEQTACFVSIKLEQNQQSDGLPELRKIPSMLASGYAGVDSCFDDSSICYSMLREPDVCYKTDVFKSIDTYDIPAFLRVSDSNDNSDVIENSKDLLSNIEFDYQHILTLLNQFYATYGRLPLNKEDLGVCGYHNEVINFLMASKSNKVIHQVIAESLLLIVKSEPNNLAKAITRSLRVQIKSDISY